MKKQTNQTVSSQLDALKKKACHVIASDETSKIKGGDIFTIDDLIY